MKKILCIALFAAASVLSSCVKEVEIVAPTGVSLSPATLTLLPGEGAELQATISPANATSNYLKWTTSNAAVAAVTGHGQVIGVAPAADKIGPGTATITATSCDGAYTASCVVTVNPINVTSVSLNKTATTVFIDASETLTATVAPENASYKTVKWSSSDESVATVDASGKVTGIDWGTAVITATTDDGAKVASCTVTVEEADPTEVENLNWWKGDKAGQRKLLGTTGTSTANWLTYKNGTASWTENTTGAPRTATVTTDKGSSLTINQMEAKDVAGAYTFYNYSFKALSNTVVVNQSGRQHETAVTFEAVENPEMLNGHLHNLDLVGLYKEFRLPVSLEITEDGPVFFTYLSLDYQTVEGGVEVAIIPELTNTTSYSTGYFAEQKFGVDNCNYAWVGWGINDLFAKTKFTLGTGDQRLVSESRYFCGFSIVTKGYATGAYTTIYQLNYCNKWVWNSEGGAYFCKK